MAYTMVQVSGLVPSKTRATKLSPNIYEFDVEANETGILAVAAQIDNIGSAIIDTNPYTLKVYSSFTEGETWELVTPSEEVSAFTVGWITWKRSQSVSSIIGSRVKVVIEPTTDGANSWVNVVQLLRTNLDPEDNVFSPTTIDIGAITATTGFIRDGSNTNVIQDTGIPANSRPLPVTLLDGLTGQPINSSNPITVTDSLPNGADTQTFSYPDAVTEVITFTKAGVPVKTVTITYTDATKETLSSIVHS